MALVFSAPLIRHPLECGRLGCSSPVCSSPVCSYPAGAEVAGVRSEPSAVQLGALACSVTAALVLGRRRREGAGRRASAPRCVTCLAVSATASARRLPATASSGSIQRRAGEEEVSGPGLTYNAVRLEEYFASRPFLVLGRLLTFAGAALKTGLATVSDQMFLSDSLSQLERDRRLAIRFRELFVQLGPTFVKLGQALSVRPDVLPEVFLEEFQEFQDSVPAFDDEEAVQLVLQALHLSSLSELFSEFGSSPVAAASLGQVYRARLTDGTEVAVKVQRPRIDDIVALDLILARQAAKLLSISGEMLPSSLLRLLPPGLAENDFEGLIDAFGQRVFEELDYNNEVKNAQRFLHLYGDQPKLKVPVVYPTLTTRRVIVMEWINGVKLTDQTAIGQLKLDPLDLISVGIECSMRQLLEHGFFHADPHPGNFFATPTGELCVLDFGLMSEMPKDARLSVIQHIVHIVNRDYAGMANDYTAMGFLSPDIDVRPIIPKLRDFFEPRLVSATVSSISFKTIVDGLNEVIFKNYSFTLPTFYALVVRSVVTLEGLALTIDPNYRVLAAAYPYVARRILLDAELRSSLVELLFTSGAASQASRFRWDRAANLLRESSKSTAPVPSSRPSEEESEDTSPTDDTYLLLDLASSLVEDPAFRKILVSELAATADAMIADFWSSAVVGLVGPAGSSFRRVLGADDCEDQDRVTEVRDTVNLVASKVVDRIPSAQQAMEGAMKAVTNVATGAAGQAFRSVAQAAQGMIQQSDSSVVGGKAEPTAATGKEQLATEEQPNVAGEFFGQLGERAAVRALRSLSRLFDNKGQDASDAGASPDPGPVRKLGGPPDAAINRR